MTKAKLIYFGFYNREDGALVWVYELEKPQWGTSFILIYKTGDSLYDAYIPTPIRVQNYLTKGRNDDGAQFSVSDGLPKGRSHFSLEEALKTLGITVEDPSTTPIDFGLYDNVLL